MQIPCTDHITNEEVLKEKLTKKNSAWSSQL